VADFSFQIFPELYKAEIGTPDKRTAFFTLDPEKTLSFFVSQEYN
jgi:hypothetical protein